MTSALASDWLAMQFRTSDVTVHLQTVRFVSNALQGVAALLCFVFLRKNSDSSSCVNFNVRDVDGVAMTTLSDQRALNTDDTNDVTSPFLRKSNRSKNTCAASLPSSHRPRSFRDVIPLSRHPSGSDAAAAEVVIPAAAAEVVIPAANTCTSL